MLKSFRFITIILILAAIFFPGFAKLQELKGKLTEIEKQVRKTKSENDALEDRIVRMKNQDYLEIVARDKMGVVKKGETVIKIIREGENNYYPESATAVNATKSKLP